jgi:hypothetical protein
MVKKELHYLPHLIFLLLAFLLYGNTLSYDYTLDDLMVIRQNSFTTQGVKGIPDIFSYDSFTGFFGKEKKLVSGGRYRPLSIATFAIEYQFRGGFSPGLSHFNNILLYAITGMLLFLLVKKLLPGDRNTPWFFGFPFIVTCLFLVHPVHTEVVANIKGRDEILALLFSLASALIAIKYARTGRFSHLLLSCLFLFLALLSKENSIAFVLIIPLILYFFTKPARNVLFGISGCLILTALTFVLVRFIVLGYLNSGDIPGELLNNPFLESDTNHRIGTILVTLGIYLKLLFFPLTLTHDYYPYHISLIPVTDVRALASLLVYLVLIAVPFIWRKERIIILAVAIYLFPLFIVSNILFPVGTFMNERFIYISSFGFILGIIYIIWYKIPGILKPGTWYHKYVLLAIIFIGILFAVKTISRNRVWKDNFTLFTTDVLTSENSIKCNIAAGGEWMKLAEVQTDSALVRNYFDRSMKYLEKALSIYPKAVNGLVLYGNALAKYRKDYKGAIGYYSHVLEFEPFEPNAFRNILIVLNSLDNQKEIDFKISKLRQLKVINPDNPEVSHTLGKLYGQFKGKIDSSRYFLEEAYRNQPDNATICKDLGVACGLLGDYEIALKYLSKSIQLNPSDLSVKQNIATTKHLIEQKKRQQFN